MSDINNFEDKIELAFPDAKQVKVSDVLGDNLIFRDYVERTGDTGEYYIVLAEHKNILVSFSCGSKTIMKQLRQLKESSKLPTKALFKRVKNKEKTFNYYTLTAPEVEKTSPAV